MESMQVVPASAVRAPAGGLPVLATGATHSAEQGQYLIFTLGGESFAIGILAIKEIIEYGSLTEVPMMPEVVRGVINLRGAVVPVIDLAVRFGKPAATIGRRTCIVIIEITREDGQSQDIGVLVDAVSEVIEIPARDIEPPPSFGSQIRTDFIRGVGRVNERFVLLLDIGRAFSFEEIGAAVAQHNQLLAGQAA